MLFCSISFSFPLTAWKKQTSLESEQPTHSFGGKQNYEQRCLLMLLIGSAENKNGILHYYTTLTIQKDLYLVTFYCYTEP